MTQFEALLEAGVLTMWLPPWAADDPAQDTPVSGDGSRAARRGGGVRAWRGAGAGCGVVAG